MEGVPYKTRDLRISLGLIALDKLLRMGKDKWDSSAMLSIAAVKCVVFYCTSNAETHVNTRGYSTSAVVPSIS